MTQKHIVGRCNSEISRCTTIIIITYPVLTMVCPQELDIVCPPALAMPPRSSNIRFDNDQMNQKKFNFNNFIDKTFYKIIRLFHIGQLYFCFKFVEGSSPCRCVPRPQVQSSNRKPNRRGSRPSRHRSRHHDSIRRSGSKTKGCCSKTSSI